MEQGMIRPIDTVCPTFLLDILLDIATGEDALCSIGAGTLCGIVTGTLCSIGAGTLCGIVTGTLCNIGAGTLCGIGTGTRLVDIF